MNAHAIADATSLALHREVAKRLRADPTLADAVRRRLVAWSDRMHPYCRERWATLLDGPVEELCAFLESDSQAAIDMRQSTPFVGIVDAATRWRIWREVRGR